VEIDGVNINQVNIRHLRESMTIVGQEPILFNLSIAENIAYGLTNVHFDDIVAAAKLANIHTFVNKLPDVSLNCVVLIIR
jgi:ATP-binding cassette subfamily B (MDR/TAP) protein 1